jgi:hypothetical protein
MKLSSNISSKIPDNDQQYLSFLKIGIEHSDPECDINLHHNKEKIIVHIVPSQSEFKEDIIQDILSVHKFLKLIPRFSSSLKISKTISFSVTF